MVQASGWGLAQQALFLHQVAKSLGAGLSLSQTLSLAQNRIPRSQQPGLQRVIHQVEQGQSFALALQSLSRLFNAWTRQLIKTAEYSGALAPLLEQLAQRCEAQIRRRRYVRSATGSALVLLSSFLCIGGSILGLPWGITLLGLGLVLLGSWIVLATPSGEDWRWQLPILKSVTEANA
jgi:type II secretory pathway component PulF